MGAEAEIKDLLHLAARAVLIDVDTIAAAINLAEKTLAETKATTATRRARIELEMSKNVLLFTQAYVASLKVLNDNYQRRLIHADAVAEDLLKR